MVARIKPQTLIFEMLRTVWLTEQGNKSIIFERERTALLDKLEKDTNRLMADIVDKPTPLQERLSRLGYPGYPYHPEVRTITLPQYNGSLAASGGANMYTANVMATAAYNQQAAPCNQLAQNNQLTLNAVSQQGRVVGMDYTKTTVYKLIRAIEELGADDPQYTKFRYDDDAADLADYRMVPDHIPVTQVVSMSLCNGCDPDLAVIILDANKQSISEDERDG